MNARIRDLLGSVLMLVFVVSLWLQRDYTTPFGGIFPDIAMFCLAALIVVTILLMFTPWLTIKKVAEKEKEKAFYWFDMTVVGIILLAWTLLLRHLGFIATGLLGFGSISWFLNDQRYSLRGVIKSFTVGAVMVGVLVFVFEYLLKVPLPKGAIF